MANSSASRKHDRSSVTRRALLRAVVFLSLGAAVNVAVAWGCAVTLCVDPDAMVNAQVVKGDEFDHENADIWQLWLVQRAGATRIWSEYYNGESGYYRTQHDDHTPQNILETIPSLCLTVDDFRSNDFQRTTVVDARGWPLVSMCWRTIWGDDNRGYGSGVGGYSKRPGIIANALIGYGYLEDGLLIDNSKSNPESILYENNVLPTRPLWPGFAINTIFYAIILCLVFAAPVTFRRWCRKKKGLCPRCAYPVGGSDVCTECGCAVR